MPPELRILSEPRATDVSTVGAAAVILALAFLLPNHSPPWMSLLQESLAVMALIVLAVPTFARARAHVEWHLSEVLILGLLAVPAIQYIAGVILFLQTAWMGSLFLFGLLVSLLAGAAMERQSPGQVLWFVLIAACLAGITSVGLQLYQWLVLPPGEGTLWVYRATGGRPAANLGQPNSLASLIVFALLATYWLWRRAVLGGRVSIALACFLIMGLALTQSRAGLLSAVFVGGALVVWHRRRVGAKLAQPVLGLLTLLVAAFLSYSTVSRELGLHVEVNLTAERASAGVRPQAWHTLAEAVLERPFGGHGWGQTFAAQMAVALDQEALNRVFLTAHNLVLDLVVWSGLAVGFGVALALFLWLAMCARRMRDETSLLMLLYITPVLVHAMFEHPLTYAYFLFPVGLVAGALNERVGMKVVWRAPPHLSMGLLLAGALAFGITLRDYVHVEPSYRDLLLEKARIEVVIQGTPPDVLVLTSLRDLIVFSRVVTRAGVSDEQLDWMGNVMRIHPSATGFSIVAATMALNGRPAEAQRWVDMLCNIFSRLQCVELAGEWSKTAEENPALKAIRWP